MVHAAVRYMLAPCALMHVKVILGDVASTAETCARERWKVGLTHEQTAQREVMTPVPTSRGQDDASMHFAPEYLVFRLFLVLMACFGAAYLR